MAKRPKISPKSQNEPNNVEFRHLFEIPTLDKVAESLCKSFSREKNRPLYVQPL